MVGKPRAKSRLRISGVVKAMNIARDRLSTGIPATEADGFRRWVTGIISAVDQICKQNRLSPKQLSAPTYRAYQFLKSLDLENLPASGEGSQPAKPRARVSNLIALCSRLQARMSDLARLRMQKPKDAAGMDAVGMDSAGMDAVGIEREYLELQRQIQENTRRVEQICRNAQSTPEALPMPSRRAYQWIKFLSDPENLSSHMQTSQLALEANQDLPCRHKLPASRRKMQASLQLFNIPALYRTRLKKAGLEIVASEGFTGAPKTVLADLICSALSKKDNPYLARLRLYAESGAFIKVLQALQPSGTALDQPDLRGQFFDLNEVFERVNQEYFNGLVRKPRLTWNKTVTHRKLGHYQPSNDIVMVSITLDRSDVPDFVLDFVMYHELLHKELGISNVNGRRYAHNNAFRTAERKFKFYTEAQEFLDQIGQKLAL